MDKIYTEPFQRQLFHSVNGNIMKGIFPQNDMWNRKNLTGNEDR